MSKGIGHFTVLLALVGLVTGLYLEFSSRAFEFRKAAMKKPDLPEKTVRDCAERMICQNYYTCEGFLDGATLKAKPEATKELYGYLKEILKQAPELEPMVEYFGTVKWEYECRVIFTVGGGQSEVPLEIEELLERFDGLVFRKEDASRRTGGQPSICLDFVLRDTSISAIGLTELMRISPRVLTNGVRDLPKMPFNNFCPGSEFRDVGLVLEGKPGEARISFMGYLKNGGAGVWTFECGPSGARRIN